MLLENRHKGYYQKAYKIIIETRRRSLNQSNNIELSKLEIKKGLLEFLNFLEKIISSPKLKYSDISLFAVLDYKFIFPQESENFYYTEEKRKKVLEVISKFKNIIKQTK
jgi:hypothetical protein